MMKLLFVYFYCCFFLFGLGAFPVIESFVLPGTTTTTTTRRDLFVATTRTTPPRTLCRRGSTKTNHGHSSSSSSSSSSTTRAKSTRRGKVLFQKIVRDTTTASSNNNNKSDLEFLGSLVAWLQDAWELPPKLPMVYEKHVHDDNSSEESDKNIEDNQSVITWNSSLSPVPVATALHVDVVAVYPENKNAAVMAMVVVSKAATAPQAWTTLPPMLQNLFLDAEKRIVGSLDRDLQDWQTTSSSSSRTAKQQQQSATQQTWNQAKRDMLGELMEEMPTTSGSSKQQEQQQQSTTKASSSSPILDAEIVDTTAAAAAAGNVDDIKSDATSAPVDFAVQAARRIVQQQSGQDFAVRAARQAVQARQMKVKKEPPLAAKASRETVTSRVTPPPNSQQTAAAASTANPEPLKVDPRAWRPPSLSQEVLGARSFAQTISRPEDYAQKRRNKPRAATASSSSSSSSQQSKSMPTPPSSRTKPKQNQEESKKTTRPKEKDSPPKVVPDTKNRKVNIVSEETMDSVEEERLRMANEAMNEVANAATDLSPEEMLEAVMKFGDEKQKQETVGQGFVSGAFEKAKEILKEQHRKREERLRQKVTTKVVEDFPSSVRPNIKFEDDQEKEAAPLSAEEELRRMFEAGEKLADSRITVVQPESSPAHPTPEEDKLIDQLVASNKEVSSHARVLDDELVELEMRINKSPDEAMDAAPQNPVFDIFSGPELYNPNVDPETAVNWPGALPDTKTNVRLPKELDEAVKQARFAANILSKVNEKEEEDGTKVFFVGDRQLSQDQVENMRAVVSEAAGLGLISDPLQIMTERSRLQMIIDELWNQPEERFRDIVSEYKDLLLSDHFVGLVKERLREMADRDIDALRQEDTSLEQKHEREREILGGLVAYAQLLLKEARALGAELEAQQLEVIRSICKVAMDPSLKTEEETATALSDAVRDMRPLFDDAFVAYLKYAVAEEEARLARAGVLDDPDHAQWLYVLKIVQQGVYNEIFRGISRYIDHIFYILRMETPKERRMLLSEIIDALPTLDVRPFVQVVENISGALGDGARGEFDGAVPLGEMTNKILQLHRDVRELLPPERIALMSRDADEWAKRQKAKLLEQRNLTKQRLKAARETEHLEDEISAMGRRGEMERFD